MIQNWKAHLILFTTSLIQGFNFSVAKIVMPEYVQPGAIIIIRAFCAVMFFWPFSMLIKKEKIHKKDYLRILFCTIFGIALNQLLFYKGLSLTKPINASLMVTISPAMVLIISAIVLKERINLKKVAGLIIGASGVTLLLLSSSEKGPDDIFLGDLLILINATSYACFLVTVKPLMHKYHPITILKWMFLLGLFMVFPFGAEGLLSIQWQSFTLASTLSLLFVIIFATILAYLLNTGVLRTTDPSLSGTYIYLQPMLASIIAVLMGKDEITLPKIVFSVIILAGVYLVSSGQKRPNSSTQ